MRILIVSGGRIDEDFAAAFYAQQSFDRVIAADRGLETVDRLGFAGLTDIVGDFDTVKPEILKKYSFPGDQPDADILTGPCKERPRIHRFRPEKDFTDTDLALRLAIGYCRGAAGSEEPMQTGPEADAYKSVCEKPGAEMTGSPRLEQEPEADSELQEDKEPEPRPDGSSSQGRGLGLEDQIWILGATGTRLDHVLANITMLLAPLAYGIPAYIQDANNRICLLKGSMEIRKQDAFGTYVSLIPLSEELHEVTLTGVKYPLSGHTVKLGESLCVSNEIQGEAAHLRIGGGIAVVLQTRD